MPVATSNLITTLDEAREYYRASLAGVRKVTCCGRRVSIVFPVDVVHPYSEASLTSPPPAGSVIVSQQVGEGLFEVRVFSLKRARLLDSILPAISLFTVSIIGQRGNKVLHGPRLVTGEYMRVVLRRGPKDAWTCVSAFPINARTYMQAWNSKRAKFPP